VHAFSRSKPVELTLNRPSPSPSTIKAVFSVMSSRPDVLHGERVFRLLSAWEKSLGRLGASLVYPLVLSHALYPLLASHSLASDAVWKPITCSCCPLRPCVATRPHDLPISTGLGWKVTLSAGLAMLTI
jgi:hypothetical protein